MAKSGITAWEIHGQGGDGNRVKGIIDEIMPGMEWVLAGKGLATVKIDGTCCAVLDGKFYKRYDAKKIPEIARSLGRAKSEFKKDLLEGEKEDAAD